MNMTVWRIKNKGIYFYDEDKIIKYFFEVSRYDCEGCLNFLQVTKQIYESMSLGQLITVDKWRRLDE